MKAGNTDSPKLRANAKTEYDTSVAKVESDRSKWLVAMETEKKEADKQWDALASKIDTSNMTGRDLSALLSQTPSTNGLAVNSPNALADNFNTSLQNLQNTKFTFNSTDYRDEIAGYRSSGQPVVKPDSGFDFSALNKLTALQTVKSFLTDPFSTQSSYSIFNPEIKAPDTSVTGINLDKAFTNSFNGVQNMAYVTGTTDAADKIAKDYYDSIVNQYKYTFNEEVMYDLKMKAAIREWNADAANANNQIVLEKHYDLKAARKKEKELGVMIEKGHEFSNAQLVAWEKKHKAEGDIAALDAADQLKYKNGDCYKNIANCGFMEVNKDLKSIKVENGQIVITREISDGTIHKGSEPVEKGGTDYNLVGGYSSGKQKDVIRVNMAKMGVIIQNPKDLFTEWSNEDYNAIADNLNTKANELYASAEKDSKAITSGITDSVKRGEHFMAIAMGAAQKAVAQDQMMQSIAQAYLTGGMAGIQQMVKDKIRDAFIDKVAEATGINPDLVRFASGRFEQAKLNKKMNSQAGGLGSGAGAVMGAGLMMAMGPVGPLMMAGPLGATALGAGAGAKLGSKMISGGTMANLVNNPMVQAGITAVAGPGVGMMVNKALQKTSFVQNNNKLNALKQQENALIQDAAGQAVANAIGRPDAAGNFSQILGGLKKRQVAKRDNANLGKVATKGIASALNMGSGMIKGIVKNAVIAVGGSGETFDHLTANPFTPTATWTGAAKVDMSKEGWKDRFQEKAMADFLEANGMDESLATTVASTTNAKIKAKKAKKEEKTKAIESTAQTALAITAIALTGGAAGPALGSVLTGGASGTFYAVQGANIALQAAIGSRTGGVQGAVAGVVNGTLQAVAATNFGKLAEGADKLLDKADEIQTMAINNPLIAKTMAATNVSYSKENGWGIKANLSGVVNALGVRGGVNFERFTNVTIGQSQRGGASVNLGFNTGKGTLGVNYTGATGKFDGSFDVKELQSGTGKLSAELNYGEDGFSVSGNADLGNGLGFGLENGRNGMSGSLTILGSTQGTVDGDGNYEANGNFLGEISGQDIIDLNKARADQRLAEENERNPAKSAKDAANAKDAADAKDARDDGAKEVGGEEGPSGLVDLAFAGLGVVMSAGAAFLAGGGSGSASSSVPASGQSGAGNGANATVARKPEDEKDGKVKRDGDTTNEPPKKQPTKEELANFKDNIFLNTTRAVTDAYLAKLDAQGVDTTDMRAHAEALRAKGVRDLTASEIQAKREKAANKENPPFKNASSIVPEIKNYTILDNNGKPMKVGIPDSIISRDGDSVEERNSKPFIYIKYDDGSDGIIPNPKFENPDKAKEFLDDIKSGRRQAPAVGDNMQNVHKFGTNILGIQTSDPMHDNQVIWAYLKAKHGIELDSKHPNLMDDPIIKKLAKEDPDLYFKLGNLIAGAVWNDDPDFYFYSQMPGRVKDLPATTRLKLGKENQDKSFPGNKDILASDAKSFWFTHEKLSKEFFQKFDIIRDSFHIRSHFGDLQFLHSMAKEGDNPYDTRNKMLSYSEMMYKIYTNQVDGRTAFFQKAFFGDKSLYTAFKTDDHEALRNRVLGSVMHIIEDSYAGGHTVRDEKTGKISYFQSYETQDPDKHGASDKTKPGQTWDRVQGTDFGREQSEMLLQFAERKPKPASWSEVEAHLKEKVWGFVKIEGKESPEPAHSHPSYKPDSKPKTIKEIAEDELKAIKEKIEKQLKEQKDKIYQQNQIQEQRNVPPTPWYPDV